MWYCVGALEKLLNHEYLPWTSWSIPSNTRVVLIGHSNGGQGAWHIAERFPDRVVAGKLLSRPLFKGLTHAFSYPRRCIHQVSGLCTVDAIAVCLLHGPRISILTRWQSARHFVDPALNSILESSLTPDDNDLFLSNIAGVSVLAVHGWVYFVTASIFSDTPSAAMMEMCRRGIPGSCSAC